MENQKLWYEAGKSALLMPDEPEHWSDAGSAKPQVGEYILPSLGRTYLHPEFADRVGDFIQRAKDKAINLRFSEGYRDEAAQAAMRRNPEAITPAENSLHSAGRGVDIHWRWMDPAAQRNVVDAAKEAGLSWGGDWRTPDRPHFYLDPGTDRRQLIDNFSRAVAAFRSQIPDR